jgi:hypothetical protein
MVLTIIEAASAAQGYKADKDKDLCTKQRSEDKSSDNAYAIRAEAFS